MKAHRFKTKLTTKEDVWQEFNNELIPKVDAAIRQVVGKNAGALDFLIFKQSEEGIKISAKVKMELVKQWEQKGRNMAFLKDNFEFSFMNLLAQKLTGKSLK